MRRFATPSVFLLVLSLSLAASPEIPRAQTPTWSTDDMQFFLHGSMSTEVVPEKVLAAFRATYPDLFPGNDLTPFGLLPDAASDLPVGLSRRKVPHLANLPAVGINCASCHVTEITSSAGGPPVRILGAASHFDPEAFFGSVILATYQTADPENMARFLKNYAAVPDKLNLEQKSIKSAILAQLITECPRPETQFYPLTAAELSPTNTDAPALAGAMLKLFYNMRAALHVPQHPIAEAVPRSGPGRNNAFGILSRALFNEPTIYGPVKFGIAWNLADRTWVHWDANTRSPVIRNIAAALGLGAPLTGHHADLDFPLIERHTALSEKIRAPRYPWKIDAAAADRGRKIFETQCASCHAYDARAEDQHLYAPDEIKTDPNRAKLFSPHQADNYNKFFAALETSGYKPPADPPIRSTGKYVAPNLAGLWARSPYLHNGSVRTMMDLLTPADSRPLRFHRGSHTYDESALGFIDDGPFLFDTKSVGNANTGHEYATTIPDNEKRDLIEYVKSL